MIGQRAGRLSAVGVATTSAGTPAARRRRCGAAGSSCGGAGPILLLHEYSPFTPSSRQRSRSGGWEPGPSGARGSGLTTPGSRLGRVVHCNIIIMIGQRVGRLGGMRVSPASATRSTTDVAAREVAAGAARPPSYSRAAEITSLHGVQQRGLKSLSGV